jgi:hypothetical protein
MALPYLTDITTFCRTVVEPNIKDNILKSNPLMFRLIKNQRDWVGGTYYDVPIWTTANSNAQSYQDGVALKTAHVDQATRAQFPRSKYNVAIMLYGSEFDANMGKGKVLNLVAEKTDKAIADLKDKMGTDLFSSNPGAIGDSKLEGLLNVTGDSLVKWGNVATADFTSWLPNGGYGYDLGTTALTESVLNKAFYKATIDNSTKPTIMVTTSDLFAQIEATWLQGKAQYLDPQLAEAGFDQIRVKGMTTVWDSHCPSASLFMLNEKALWLGVSPSMDFKFIDFEYKIDADYMIAHIRWYGNLIGNHRASQVRFSALTSVA